MEARAVNTLMYAWYGRTLIPNTFIIGAQKAGTTFLRSLLVQHPDVEGGTTKEPSYFTPHYNNDLEWYLRHYDTDQPAKVCIDASTTNALVGIFPETPHRILEVSPDARFIYVVRNPFDRIISSWIQMRNQIPAVHRDFNAAVRNDRRLIEGSRYWTNLCAYRKARGDESIHVILFADLVSNPNDVTLGALRFLNLDPSAFTIDSGEADRNSSSGKLVPGRLLDAMHRIPFFARFQRIAPEGLKQRLDGLLRHPIATLPKWEPSTLSWAADVLRDESANVLKYVGQDVGIWTAPSSSDR